MVNGVIKKDEFIDYLKKLQKDTEYMPKKDICPVGRIRPNIVHIFKHYIDVRTISHSDVDEIMKIIDKNVSDRLKQCIVSEWICLTDDLDTYQSRGTRTKIIEDHVFRFVR
jgi:hypothetical protein